MKNLQYQKTKCSPPKTETKQRCLPFPLLFSILLEVLASLVRERKKVKKKPYRWGRKNKTSLLEHGMIVKNLQ